MLFLRKETWSDLDRYCNLAVLASKKKAEEFLIKNKNSFDKFNNERDQPKSFSKSLLLRLTKQQIEERVAREADYKFSKKCIKEEKKELSDFLNLHKEIGKNG